MQCNIREVTLEDHIVILILVEKVYPVSYSFRYFERDRGDWVSIFPVNNLYIFYPRKVYHYFNTDIVI